MVLAMLLTMARAADGLYPLASLDRDTPDAELAPFADVIGDATFVGLGESLHCGGTYLEGKARLVRWLVETQGFRLVTIESPWAWGQPATRYVATGEGDASTAMRSFFLAFRDRETEAMLAWLAAWNRGHPDDPVVFHGFDVQDGVPVLVDFLRERGVAEDDLAACTAGPCEVASDDPWVRLAVDTLRVRHALDAAGRGWDYYDVRDAGMADTLLAVRELAAPGARTILLAHNGHLARDLLAWPWTPMGEHLAERLGDDYVSIGLVATELETSCQGNPVEDARYDVERAIREAAGAPAALVDLRAAPWLAESRSLGGERSVPAEQHDALIWWEEARAADNGQWEGTPGEDAEAVRYFGMTSVLTHPGPIDDDRRESLWTGYAAWLASTGWEPDGRRRTAPWNRVTWQRFRRGEYTLVLEVRHPGDERWRVWVHGAKEKG